MGFGDEGGCAVNLRFQEVSAEAGAAIIAKAARRMFDSLSFMERKSSYSVLIGYLVLSLLH